MNKWTTSTQYLDSIGTGIIGLGISLTMVVAMVSLAVDKHTTQYQNTTRVVFVQPLSTHIASVQVTSATLAR